MQFTTLLLAALSAALASAAPATHAKRACATQYPNSIGFPINYDIAKTADRTVSPFVSFNIPAGARGPCSLEYVFPAGYPIETTSGDGLVNVRDAGGALAGSVRFESAPDRETRRTINSFACPAAGPSGVGVAQFRLEIAGDEGEVKFSEVQGAGLIMTYNC